VQNQPPTPGEIVIMAAGAVMLIASFLDFSGDTSAWGSGAFPVATLIVIYGIIMATQVALARFANANLSDRVAGFTWEQVHLLLAVFAFLMALGWLISGISDKGVGLWLLFLGSIALVAGAVMLQRERNTGALS
jgi:hypothetical protein